jgi:hypothetical protein
MAAEVTFRGIPLDSREINASRDFTQKNPSDLVTVGKH